MVIAEETGQPGDLLVRFKASQRELLLDELELFRSTAEEAIEMVSQRPDANPAYLDLKQAELETAQVLIATIVGTVELGEDFHVIGPAVVLCSSIRSAAGVACERLSTRVNELRPGLDSDSETGDVQKQWTTVNTWLRTLLAVNGFEPVRTLPPDTYPAAADE